LLAKAVAVFVASMCQGFKWIFLPLYLVGNIELVRRKPQWAPIVLVALLGVVHILVLLAVFMNSGYIAHRHVLPLVGLAMPFTALGIVYAAEKLSRFRFVSPHYAMLAIVGLASLWVLPYTMTPFSREFIPVIDATRWVDTHAASGEGVISNSPYVAFYAQIPAAYLGNESPTLDDAMSKAPLPARFDFVVLHVNAHAYRPEWLKMIEASYRPVAEFSDAYSPAKRPRKVVVFESKDRPAQLGSSMARTAH
jgi:hypothetical protein